MCVYFGFNYICVDFLSYDDFIFFCCVYGYLENLWVLVECDEFVECMYFEYVCEFSFVWGLCCGDDVLFVMWDGWMWWMLCIYFVVFLNCCWFVFECLSECCYGLVVIEMSVWECGCFELKGFDDVWVMSIVFGGVFEFECGWKCVCKCFCVW